jgi:hypothetical protein
MSTTIREAASNSVMNAIQYAIKNTIFDYFCFSVNYYSYVRKSVMSPTSSHLKDQVWSFTSCKINKYGA